VNPAGTILCESCGKPIEENQYLEGIKQNHSICAMKMKGRLEGQKHIARHLWIRYGIFFVS